MTTAVRPLSNLVIPKHLMMGKALQSTRFMYVYASKYRGTPTAFMTRLWASVLFPSMTSDPRWGTGGVKAASALQTLVAPGYLQIRKMGDHYVAAVPLFKFPTRNVAAASSFLRNFMLNGHRAKGVTETAEHVRDMTDMAGTLPDAMTTELTKFTYPASAVISAMGSKLDPKGGQALKDCLIQVRLQSKGNLTLIFADFRIAKDEAQQLTTTEWNQIRDIDIYPLLLHWVKSAFGERGAVSTASFPISKIVNTLPKDHTVAARINEYGLSIGPTGVPWSLPKEVDKAQTRVYEDRYMQSGIQEDGSFSLINMEAAAAAMSSGVEPKVKLPSNMVVAVDWVNSKFSYTNTSGNLEVEDLTNFRKADPSHIRTLLEDRYVEAKHIDWFARMGEAANVSNTVSDGAVQVAEFEGLKISEFTRNQFLRATTLQDWFKVAVTAYKTLEDQDKVKFADLSVNSSFAPFRFIARRVTLIEAAVQSNLDAVYLKWSVSSVSEMLPWMTMIAKYTKDMPNVRALDERNRQAAIDVKEHGVDPKWTPPSIPLLSDKIGFLPHQSKVRNLLRDSPDFALLPVQAGGGKSILLLTDILLEIKANRSQPYLVLCPGHLVANYVKEVVYFTSGKMNVMAITNSAIRQSGFKRLQAMMEAAPRNTVVVCDYDTLNFAPQGTQRSVTYGTTPITMLPVVSFLRQFNFGYAALDESHKIKNLSSRTRAVMSLITDIPKKRLASGTMVHDSPSDLAMQVATMDPTLFGTRDEFNDKYGLNVRSGRVIEWRKGAQAEIMSKIKSRIVYAEAMRKEWAALLPEKHEWTGGEELTPKQQEMYEELLDGILTKMAEQAKGNDAKAKALQKFLKGKAVVPEKGELAGEQGDDVTDDEVEDVTDEDAGQDVESAIQPYLATLERFLINPTSVVGNKLEGEDAISPKTMRIINRLKCHVFGGEDDVGNGTIGPYGPFPGKVLIFTNNIKSAEEIFRLASPELKKCGILYKASRKLEDGAKFEKDDRIRWMVGVEQSMNEGLNFQFCARLIRSETPWNPGTLEQGNSRINRPELKKKENRNKIFFDTVVCNRTIDITKTARLLSKVIAAAKFENAANAEYATIPDVEGISMTLDAIRTKNSWNGSGTEEDPGLVEYLRANQKYSQVIRKDYAEYKQAYIDKFGKEPTLEMIEVAPTPKDAMLLKRVPYTPGLGIYNAEEMGLVRLDEFLNQSDSDEESEDEESEDEEDNLEEDENAPGVDPETRARFRTLKGQLVHTEHGDGYIVNVQVKGRMVTVDLVNGYSVKARKNQVFVITRTETSTKDIRNQLLKSVGGLPVTNDIDVPAEWLKAPKGVLKKQKEIQQKIEQKEAVQRQKKVESELAIELSVIVTNGYLGLDYVLDEENQTAQATLTGCGFRPQFPFFYAQVKNVAMLRNQMALWKEKGMTVDPLLVKQGVGFAFKEMDALLQSGQIKSHHETAKAMAGAQVVNFYRLEHKANNDKKVFKPYPILENGMAFIALPAQGQAGTKTAMLLKRPAFRWVRSTPSMSFYGSTQQVEHMLIKIQQAGVQLTNIKEIEKELHQLRKMKLRDDKGQLVSYGKGKGTK